jgi:glycosyltransferase involved in cell wall biosynthesis
MRILMVSKACIIGPYQKKLEELARLPDVELTVVVPPFWRDVAGVQSLERQHTSGYEMVVERMVLNGQYHLHFYPGLGRQMRRLIPELVHIDEEPYNLATAHALWTARNAGAKSLFFSWQNIHRRYPFPFRMLERYVLNRVDYGIVGNQESAVVWREKGYSGPLAVIPQFGVDPDIFAPTELQSRTLKSPGFVVGYVGRLVEEKGVDLLLQALATLQGDWQASIIGGGPAEEDLRALAGRLGLRERVRFEGLVASARMPGIYQQLDVLVVPSRTRSNWKEQFGRVLVEAMACGVPVVGSDSGEIPHVIGDAGFVFPEGRADILREQLTRLQADPELRASVARQARERILSHFTQARVAAETYEVYRQILSAEPRAARFQP